MYFSSYIALFLTFSEVSSILSFCLADTLGCKHRCQLWHQLLHRYGIDTNPETEFVGWESTDLPFKEPDIPVVANTRWLGSMAGWWLGGPMAAVGTVME
jgi:hypothetical protein